MILLNHWEILLKIICRNKIKKSTSSKLTPKETLLKRDRKKQQDNFKR